MMTIAPLRTVGLGSFTTGMTTDCRSELDSHADTCMVGDNTALLIQDYDQPVRVHGCNESVGQADHCRTVSAAVAYDHPENGEVYIHQAILIPTIKNNLLSMMQL